MNNLIDFSNCEIDLEHTYLGANGKKIAIIYKGEIYMLKFPSLKRNEPGYSNSVFSEYISCHIFEMLGFNTQKTILGTYTSNGKSKYVCACLDFTDDNHILQEFASIKNTIIDSPLDGFGTDLIDILNTIDEQKRIDNIKLKKFFWDMFIVDTLLGNFDRHNGNWGFLFDKQKRTSDIAPMYDCGSCLYPQPDDEYLQMELENKEEIEKRVYVFPNSALKLEDKKINPYQFINSHLYKDCDSALLRIFPKINIEDINKFIDNVPVISDIRKQYYKTIIFERYDKILKPAYIELLKEV